MNKQKKRDKKARNKKGAQKERQNKKTTQNQNAKQGSKKEEPQTEELQVDTHPPAMTSNQPQGEGAANLPKTDKWERAQLYTRAASVFTWCFDKAAEGWKLLQAIDWPDLPDLPG